MTSRRLLLLACNTVLVASAVHAQERPGNATSNSEGGPADAQMVVVTGSRLITNGDNLPTPVTVVSADSLLKTTPTNIPEGLKKLPVFALSRGTANLNNSTDNFTGNYLNLRGIGIQRNLVLLDGQRAAPTSYTGAVDANVLPQMLLERVDVVTGGASAVYGSDAVSGVINFILDKKFEGLKFTAQSGIASADGDAFSWRAGAAYGTNLFGGAGHFEASYEHFRQDGLDDKFDRANGRKVYAVAGTGTAVDPFRLITDARNGAFGFQGSILTGPLAGQQFVTPGVAGPFTHGTPQGGSLESGGDGFYGKGSSITADLTTDQAFARFDYDLADNLGLFVQGLYARSVNFNNFYPSIIFPRVIAPDNAFLSAGVQAQLTDPFLFVRVMDDPSHAFQVRSKSESGSASAGLRGEAGKFRWNAQYQHGVTTTYNYDIIGQLEGNLSAALDAVDQGRFQTGTANGNIVCRVTITNPTAYPGCVPLNAFGTDLSTQKAALDYVTAPIYNRPRFTLDDVSLSIAGPVFDNWAGPVNAALSAEWRELALDVSTNAPASILADCTGLRFDCTQGVTPLFRAGQITPISESERISEAALEVDFPLLVDKPLAQSLDVNAAVRYTDYSTSGSVETWKGGLDWHLVESLRFRATRSRDIRAPSLYELFQPSTFATSGYVDLHTGFNGITPIETTGNSTLVPEIANTFTAGAVFNSTSIPGFSVAIDYYRIKIDNAIAAIDGRVASIQQVCEASGGTSDFCNLYERPLPFSDRSAANAPTLVRLQALNASTLKTWGVDGEVNYRMDVGPGRLSLRGLIGYQPELTTVLAPGLTPLDGAGVAASQGVGGVPKWRLTAFVTYGNDLWSIDVQERWRSSLKWDANGALVYDIPDVASVAYTDLNFSFNIGRDVNRQVFLSAQNLFDKDPPVYLTSGTSGTPAFSFPAVAGDDVIGRYITLGARFRF